ncbi:MAG: hypothetical protein SPG61_02950 [Arcanobacterium sp.]|nr:hypothetical protein [Arcanobacterium sp.]
MADELHDEISESLEGLRDIKDLFENECECCGDHGCDEESEDFAPLTSLAGLQERLKNKVNWTNVTAVTLGAFAHYATPDFISSKKLRTLTKGAILGGIGALYYPRLKEDVASTWGELREIEEIIIENESEINSESVVDESESTTAEASSSEPETVGSGCSGNCAGCSCGGEKSESEELLDMVQKQRMVLVTSAAIATVVSVSAAALAEKFLYRRAQKKRADGVRAAHTKQAWKLGIVSGLTSLAEELVR